MNVREPWREMSESVKIGNVQQVWREVTESGQIGNVQETWREEIGTWNGNMQEVWMLVMEIGNGQVKLVVNLHWGTENVVWETLQMAYIHHIHILQLSLPFPSVVLHMKINAL